MPHAHGDRALHRLGPMHADPLALAAIPEIDIWMVLAPCLVCKGFGIMLCLPVLTTLLSNATPPDMQGMTQVVVVC